MQVTEQSATLLTESDIYKKIEIAGRVCYKSEGNIKSEMQCNCKKAGCLACSGTGENTSSAKIFTKKIVSNKHHSVLEHGIIHVVFNLRNLFDESQLNGLDVAGTAELKLQLEAAKYALAYSATNKVTSFNSSALISGNVRRWKVAFSKSMNPLMRMANLALGRKYPLLFCTDLQNAKSFKDDPFNTDKFVKVFDGDDVPDSIKSCFDPHHDFRHHQFKTIRVISDRALINEILRHRNLSPSQKSTRYCVELSGMIRFLKPVEIKKNTKEYNIWKRVCKASEKAYSELIELGVSPQNARSVLPLSLESEAVFTASVAWWQDVIDQRSTDAAHPDIKKVLAPMLCEALKMTPTDKYGKLYQKEVAA